MVLKPLKFSLLCLTPAVLLGGACTLSGAQITESNPAANGPVHIKVSRPAHPQIIPEALFGSFLEPIRQSTYGGLWADAVVNPSFEDGLWSSNNIAQMLHERPELRRGSEVGLPLPWEPLERSQGSRYAPIRGDAANSYQSLLLMSLPGKEVGILQRLDLPVQRELTYKGNIWIKHVEGPETVSVSLRRRDHHDQTLASADIVASQATWTKYPFSLTLKPGNVAPLDPVDLVISLSNDARAQVDNVSLFPADAVDGMDPDVLNLARELHSPLVRFGGNFTSHYDWHDGLGPADKRISKLNLSWGIPEYNTFGTDEFLNFCRLINAQPQIALNLGTGHPQDAADWVRYVNEHWGDHKGGNLWELGNELWGDFQVGYPSMERVAAKTLATSQAIRAVDPHARLIATGADEDFFHDWDAQQLATPPDTFNYLSTHFVVNDNVQLAHASDQFRTQAALALPWGLADRMQAIKKQIADSGRPDVKVAFTEWLMVSDSHTGPHFSNLGGALFAGGFLNMVLRNSDAVGVSDMTGIIDFAGIVKKHGQAYGSPAYWVLRAYSSTHPHLLLAVQSDSPTYNVTHGIQRLPEISNVPYLDVIAAESADGKSLVLFCVNRHLTHAATAEVDLSAFGVKSGTARISTITGENILVENDEVNPNTVTPIMRSEAFKSKLTYTFPSKSVTVVEIPKDGLK
ncbi:alpha-L-arabinofuranosidase C-terminal domain-containing protein [Granulicella tundricola]|uniref:non-reducing end alpha-L-arabinofuranosidase n=1 Tax=Granulicella tundricola (strain ATCC BAA-1859 / DSM 23138 / MP5ACTX9) TaxID=1198114 RepID=E8WZJ0_GRATM|nr:alpha-L-arabinofuranosidase C-terminal domain-containing protein [Granulicella tundricola]ADW68878.1 Alpha-N-arabinofuranosidase [Granulicella tundricola MP5ACTX9]